MYGRWEEPGHAGPGWKLERRRRGHHARVRRRGDEGERGERQGRLYAFDDAGTHQGCSLANGDLDGTTLTCACHGARFDVTSGAVLHGPAERPVRSRTVQVEGDDLLIEV